MANRKPLTIDTGELTRFQVGDTVGVEHGGTGATTEAAARSALGLEIGSDVQAYSAQLETLGNWTNTGFLVGDGTGGWLPRQIATASPSRITVTNGDGVAGNTTLDLATIGSATGTGFYKFAYDAYGRVVSSTAVVAADVRALLDTVYATIANPTFTGTVTLAQDPTSPLQAATKQYVDNLFSSGGIPPFAPAVAKTDTNITLSGSQTIDGVTVIAGDRVLVDAQTDATQNGIYVVSAGAWSRASDADESSEFTPARQIFVQSGTTYANTGWSVGNTSQPTIGTDDITFVQVSGAASYTAGNGLSLTGSVFSAVGVSGQISVTGSGIGLASSGVTPGTFSKVTVDTYGRVTAGDTLVPADIGAQPVDATLTALAAYNTNGFVVQTAADTFVGRSIAGTAGQITVTDGNGSAGNPTIALATTGITAGTYNGITFDVYGRAVSAVPTSSEYTSSPAENGEASAIAIGRAVYVSASGQVKLAVANATGTKDVIGIVADTSISSGAEGKIATSGIVEATTTQWDAVTGQSGGLSFGGKYFLSNTIPGGLTTTIPTSGYVNKVGIALSSTRLKLDIGPVIKL